MSGSEHSSLPPSTLLLSGGGYRATLFHLGVLRFLYEHSTGVSEPSLLSNVKRVVGVSGGSITAAHYAAHASEYNSLFSSQASILVNFVVDNDMRRECFLGGADCATILQKLFPRTQTFSDCKSCSLEIVATDVTSGGIVCFSRDGFTHAAGTGSKIDPFALKTSTIRICYAVAASAACPPFIPTVTFSEAMFGDDLPHRALHSWKSHELADGGIRDNLGIEYLSTLQDLKHDSSSILVSDAGLVFDWISTRLSDRTLTALLDRMIRTVDIQMDRLHALDLLSLPVAKVVSLSNIPNDLSSEEDKASAAWAQPLPRNVATRVANTPTDLTNLTQAEAYGLVRLGYDLACKNYSSYGNIVARPQIPDPNFFEGLFPAGVTHLLNSSADSSLEAAIPGSSKKRFIDTFDLVNHFVAISDFTRTWRNRALTAIVILMCVIGYVAYSALTPTEPYESYSGYLQRLNSTKQEVRDALSNAVRNNVLSSPVPLEGRLKRYHFSWIITDNIVIGLVECDFKALDGNFRSPSVPSDRSFVLPLYFIQENSSEKLKFTVAQGPSTKGIPCRVVKMVIYAEDVTDGNFSWMTIKRGSQPNEFTFDVTSLTPRFAAPGPYLHEALLPFWSRRRIENVVFKPLPLVTLSEPSSNAVKLLDEITDAIRRDASDGVKDVDEAFKTARKGVSLSQEKLSDIEAVLNDPSSIVPKDRKAVCYRPSDANPLGEKTAVSFIYYMRDRVTE